MASIILILFMIAGTEVITENASIHRNDSDEDDDQSDRQIRRKYQNSLAAKKSYEAKKKERQTLLQKNTELVETQKQLLHDKSRLEKQISLLNKIMDSFDHKSCSAAKTVDANCSTVASSALAAALPMHDDSDDNNEALDLSMKGRLQVSSATTSSKVITKDHACLQNVVCDDRRQNVSDEPAPRTAGKKKVRFQEFPEISENVEDICRVQPEDTQDLSRHQQNDEIRGEFMEDGSVPDSKQIKQENDIQDVSDIKQEYDVLGMCDIKQEYDVEDSYTTKHHVHEMRTSRQDDHVFIPNGKRIKCEL